MKAQRFDSVWDTLEDAPQQAASLRARSALAMALQEWMKAEGLTQSAAAAVLGVTQPRVSDLVRGRLDLFSLDALMAIATTAGLSPRIAVERPKAAT